MRWGKGSETPSFLMLRPRERGSLRPFLPTARGSLRPFFPQKGKPRTSPNPLSENPISATHAILKRMVNNFSVPPFWGMCLVDAPPPSSLSQGICRAAGQTFCVSTRPLVLGEVLYRIHRQSLNSHRGKHRSGGAQVTLVVTDSPGRVPGRKCSFTLGSAHSTQTFVSNKTKGPGEEGGPPEIIQKFRLRNWQISSADFPMTPMERAEHHFGSLGEQDFGAISGGPFFSQPLCC